MENNYLIFKGLFEIWKNKNYDPYFYFHEIFPKALSALTQRSTEDNIQLKEADNSKYRALFVPVGFSFENVALMSSLLKPDYLRLAFTAISRDFHRRHMHLVRENIKETHPSIIINEVEVTSDDQKYTEQRIVEWATDMSVGYGLSYSQMAIDLTGGTKPMSIGAYNATVSFHDIDGFYLRSDYEENTKYPMPGTETLIPLKKEKAQVNQDLVFVIMPFAKDYDEIYQWMEEAVRTVKGAKLKCLRADKEVFAGGIMDRVRENILKAGVVIADLTEKNENVYYELGLAHGHSKKVIMLTQKLDNIPFDLKHLRLVIYDRDNKSAFMNQLIQEIECL